MSAANLDAVKRKYNFKTVSIATWRDPSQSVLPARGGPSSPSFSPDSFGRPYQPTYKVKYNHLPEPTDDEDSGHEKDEDQTREEHAESLDEPVNPDIEEVENHDPDVPGGDPEPCTDEPQTLSEDPVAPEEEVISEEASTPNDESSESQDIADPVPEDTPVPEAEIAIPTSESVEVHPQDDISHGDDDLVAEPGDGAAELCERQAATDDPKPSAEPISIMDPEVSDGLQNDEHAEHSDERRVSFAPGTPEPKPTPRKKKTPKGTKGKKKRNAVPMNELPPEILAMIDSSLGTPPPPAPEPPAEGEISPAGDIPFDDEPPMADESIGDGTVETNDSANPPGAGEALEDPSPEQDHPQDAQNAEPQGDEAPVVADDNVDGSVLEDPPSGGDPPPEDSATADTAAEMDHPEPSQTDEPLLEHTAAANDGGEALNAEAPKEDSFTSSPPPPASEDTSIDKPSKKKGSKSGKDKSKKKGSKNKTQESSPPPIGLGIDIGDTSVPDIDDLLKDIPPPSGDVSAPLEEVSGDAKAEAEDSKEAEGVSEELAASVDPEVNADAVIDGHECEFISETHPEEDAEDVKSAGSTVEDAMDEQSPEKDASDEAEANEEASALTDDQPAENESKAEPVPSPADSGVEFEDIDKTTEEDKLDEDEAQDAGPALLEDHQSAVEDVDVKTESQNDVTIENTKAASLDDADQGENESEPAEIAEQQPAVDGDSTAEAPIEPGPDKAEEVVEPGSEHTKDVSIEDINPEDEETAGEEAPISQEGDNLEADPILDPLESDTAAAEGDFEESKQSEAEVAVEESSPLEAEVAAEDPSPPAAQEVEPATPEPNPEPVQEEIVPEASRSIEDDAAAIETSAPADGGPVEESPPSPNLSKTSSGSSRKHKADHWERKHADNTLKNAFEDSVVLQKSKKGGKEEVRVKDRARRSRHTSSTEEDEARRRRRVLRKEEEARRAVEEERRQFEEDKARRIRRDERRAARKAEAEVEEKIKRLNEERESIRREREDEARRRRHREHREAPSSHREVKDVKDAGSALKVASLTLPKALGLSTGQSYHGKPTRHAEEIASPASSNRKDNDVSKGTAKEAARPSSSNGSKSHHRHRHSHRSEGEGSSKGLKDSEHRSKRRVDVVEEPPKTFFGLLRRR